MSTINIRTIMHIDMDAFFASVEQRDNPSLRGKPIGIIGTNTRTVLVTASYEARKYGVETGMNIPKAKAICPQIKLIRASHKKYTRICNEILNILDKFSPLVEVSSIDEFFLDATGLSKIFGDPLQMAREIKGEIKKKTELASSIGIAPNKLLAKLASNISKPNGLKQIKPYQTENLLKNLPVEKLCGIGKNIKNILNKIGIRTCDELVRLKRDFLIKRFGVIGERLYYIVRGIDDSPVISFRDKIKEKSIGHSQTLPFDIEDKKELLRYMLRLSDMVGMRLRRENLIGDTISVTVRYKSFKTFCRQKKIEIPTNSTRVIFEVVKHILNIIKLEEPVRLIGITVHNLKDYFCVSLFRKDYIYNKLDKTKDNINNIFGYDTIQFASLINLKRHHKIISPSWRPCGARKY